MAIRVECSDCGRSHNLNDKYAGKRIACVDCKSPITVPGPASAEQASPASAKRREETPSPRGARSRRPEPVVEDVLDTDAWDTEPETETPVRRREARPRRLPPRRPRDDDDDEPVFKSKSPKRRRRQSIDFGPIAKKIGAALGILVAVLVAMKPLAKAYFKSQRHLWGAPAEVKAMADSAATNQRLPITAPMPNFPVFEPTPGEHQLTLIGPRDVPGAATQLFVYIPPGEPEPHSLPCILIAPAGSILLTGMGVGPADRPEHLRYLSAGYVVVCYSLDGHYDSNNPRSDDAELLEGYNKFVMASAGLVNARNALEFVLAKIPSVDPDRIYAAGHSSAGTAALLFAEHEPRIKGCIAYAPATDVAAQQREALENGAVLRLLYGVKNIAVRISPKTHAASMNCPVFLFHAHDDQVVPISQSVEFGNLLQRSGKQATMYQVHAGGHFDAMMRDGVPEAIAWLKTLPGNESAGLLPAREKPTTPAPVPTWPAITPITPITPQNNPDLYAPPRVTPPNIPPPNFPQPRFPVPGSHQQPRF